jgi:hypothetical protein
MRTITNARMTSTRTKSDRAADARDDVLTANSMTTATHTTNGRKIVECTVDQRVEGALAELVEGITVVTEG